MGVESCISNEEGKCEKDGDRKTRFERDRCLEIPYFWYRLESIAGIFISGDFDDC